MIAPMDPRIGVLNSGVHYAFVDGYDKPEFRGTREEVEVRLGLRPAPVAKPKRPRSVYLYRVKVTPSVIGYTSTGFGGGSETHGAYFIEVYAANGKEAISKARKERRDEEGRFAVPATFKAERIA